MNANVSHAMRAGAKHGNQTKNRVWDPAEHLETEADTMAYFNAAFEEGDPSLIAAALGDVARAKGMAQIARDAGLGRESLYKALPRRQRQIRNDYENCERVRD